VQLLWAQGGAEAAIQFEKLGNPLAKPNESGQKTPPFVPNENSLVANGAAPEPDL